MGVKRSRWVIIHRQALELWSLQLLGDVEVGWGREGGREIGRVESEQGKER
jgi:hypothetical protein